MAEICSEFLPPGVLNVVTGRGQECRRGACWRTRASTRCRSPAPPMSGGMVGRTAPGSGWRTISLELGGKSPNIVFPDRDAARSTPRPTACSPRCASPGRASAAPPARGCSCTRTSMTSSSTALVRAAVQRSTSATRSTRPPTWVRSSTASSSTRCWDYIDDGKSHQPGVPARAGRRDARTGGPGRLLPRADHFRAASTTAGAWPRRRSSGRCWSPSRGASATRSSRMANDSHYGLAAYIWTHDLTDALDTAHRDRVRLGPGQPGRRPGGRPVLRRLQEPAGSGANSRSRGCSSRSPRSSRSTSS